MSDRKEVWLCEVSVLFEGRTDQRNAQINFSLINLLLFKLLRHVSATQLEPSSGESEVLASYKPLQSRTCNKS